MPTSNPRINDPEGQSVMDVLMEAGVEPSEAYNATQGIRNMSGDNVIAEIGVLRAEFNAAIAELRSSVDALEVTTAARFDAVDVQMAAVDSQMALLSWVVIAAFTILTTISVTGFFRANGWWPRGNSEPRSPMSEASHD